MHCCVDSCQHKLAAGRRSPSSQMPAAPRCGTTIARRSANPGAGDQSPLGSDGDAGRQRHTSGSMPQAGRGAMRRVRSGTTVCHGRERLRVVGKSGLPSGRITDASLARPPEAVMPRSVHAVSKEPNTETRSGARPRGCMQRSRAPFLIVPIWRGSGNSGYDGTRLPVMDVRSPFVWRIALRIAPGT